MVTWSEMRKHSGKWISSIAMVVDFYMNVYKAVSKNIVGKRLRTKPKEIREIFIT